MPYFVPGECERCRVTDIGREPLLLYDVPVPVEFVSMRATVRGIAPHDGMPVSLQENFVLHHGPSDPTADAGEGDPDCVTVRGKRIEVRLRSYDGQSFCSWQRSDFLG
jgi:hypothetical protein